MPPNRFESEVGNFLEGSHGDRTHIKRAGHHTVTPLCGTLLYRVSGGVVVEAGESSPCSVAWWLNREKILPARLKWPDFGVFGRAGRVLYRLGPGAAVAGRVLYRLGLEVGVAWRVLYRSGPCVGVRGEFCTGWARGRLLRGEFCTG